MFRCLIEQGAELIVLPAAFTAITGQAHWKILSQARAIENQVFFIGACQVGTHYENRQTYGHSMIIDPWGTILQAIDDQPGIICQEIDLTIERDIRQRLPISQHQKITYHWNNH